MNNRFRTIVIIQLPFGDASSDHSLGDFDNLLHLLHTKMVSCVKKFDYPKEVET